MWGFEDWEFVMLIIGGTIMICAIAIAIYLCIKDTRNNNPLLYEELIKNNNRRLVVTSQTVRYLSNINKELKNDFLDDNLEC